MLNLDLLNPEQRDAVETIEGPLLIIAGAGSGKTRVITHRIARMLELGIHQSAILALTFTNKAAREMEERIHDLSNKKLRQLTVSTFHAFGVQILKKHIDQLGYRDNFSIYDSSDQISLVKEAARTINMQTDDLHYQEILTVFSRIKTRRAKWLDINDQTLKSLFNEYQSHLKLYNAVDFDDLITLPIHLFETRSDILEIYRQQYQYIMVDEFQDTSLIQYDFMKILALGSRNICVVGDDDQSIYSWRGANFDNIRNFEKDFPERKEIKLEQNYRSTGTILEAANNLIANNKNRKIKALWTPSASGKAIELFMIANEATEADFIADSIREICLRDNLTYDDFGVLIRTNSLARHLEEAFMAKNLPYKMSGGTSFFQRPEIKDMISYLRVISNPDDDISLLRILNIPRRGIGKKSLETLSALATNNGLSLHQAMMRLKEAGYEQSTKVRQKKKDLGPLLFDDDGALDVASSEPALDDEVNFSKSAYQAILEFLDLIDLYRPKFVSGKKLADTLRLLIKDIDYWPYLVQEFQKNEKLATWRYRNVELLCQSLEQYENDPDNQPASIYSYLNRVSLQNHNDEDDEAIQGKVNLMTIHASKGLEFKVVFLAGVEDGIIPHKRSLLENEAGDYESNVEEDRRLFDVAITRAQQKLIMTSCRQRTVMRQTMEAALSPFLQEIPKELLEMKEPELKEADGETAENAFTQLRKKLGLE